MEQEQAPVSRGVSTADAELTAGDPPPNSQPEAGSSAAEASTEVEPEEQPQLSTVPGEEHVTATADLAAGERVPAAGDELEELTLPGSVQPPEALAKETVLGPEGKLRIVGHVEAQGRINHYEATWREESDRAVAVELREAPADHAGLRREAEVLSSVRYSMLPKSYASFEHDGRWYLAVEPVAGETLAHALRDGMAVDRAISIVLQLAQVLRRLHQAGWALLSFAPGDVRLGEPLRLARLGGAVPIGETPPQALNVSGYSAPELAHPAPVTGKEDVYTLGAVLFRAVAGQPLPESGAEEAALPLQVQVPGMPQLLAQALAPADERLDMEAFYAGLLSLKQRLTSRALSLEVASATSVGLNPTRLVNEDSCGYLTWSVAGVDGLTYRALLCVADGMGGMEAGEVASQTALRVVLSAATIPDPAIEEGAGERPPDSPREAVPLDLVALIKRAAPAVHAAGQGREMGTTLTCVEVRNGELTLAHVGDTRAYLLREGVLTQLTVDHSLVAAMVTSGVLTKEEARGHPDSNKVLRSLGSRRELPEEGYVDTLVEGYGKPALQLRPGDIILLCSDGVWGSVPDERIQEVLASGPDCPAAARTLIAEALRAGAPDNAAAVVARCVHAPSW